MASYTPDAVSGVDDDATMVPDLQAASGQSYGGQDSLLSALDRLQGSAQGAQDLLDRPLLPSSQGGMQEALTALLPGLLSGPSTAQRMGQALTGGASVVLGQKENPVNAILEQQADQQMGIVKMLNQMGREQRQDTQWGITNERLQKTEQRQDAQFQHKQEQDLFTKERQRQLDMLGWNKELLEVAPSDAARRTMAGQRGKLMSDLMGGVPVPPEIVEGWANQKDNPQRAKEITAAFIATGDDPIQAQTVVERFGLSQASASFYKLMSTKDAYLKAHGLPTTAELKKENADAELADLKVLDTRLSPPGFHGDSADTNLARSVAEENYPGVPLRDLTAPQRKFIFESVRTQKRLEVSEADQTRRDYQFQLNLQGMAARGEQQMALAAQRAELGSKPMTTGQQYTALKRDYQDPAAVWQSLQKLRRDAANMPPQAWPTGMDAASRWAAKQYREKVLGGDPGVYALSMSAMDIINGQIGRQFYDDKGSRALALAKNSMIGTEELPSYKTFDAFLKNQQDEVLTKLKNNYQSLEDSDVNAPQLKLGAKSVIGRISPKAKEARPGAPTEPGIKIKRRYRDTATGKTYEVNMSPGDTVPPGYVEIR